MASWCTQFFRSTKVATAILALAMWEKHRHFSTLSHYFWLMVCRCFSHIAINQPPYVFRSPYDGGHKMTIIAS
jgi:hypothetical protein